MDGGMCTKLFPKWFVEKLGQDDAQLYIAYLRELQMKENRQPPEHTAHQAKPLLLKLLTTHGVFYSLGGF